VAERGRQTGIHAQTIRRYVRRFEREGMRGLFDERALLVRSHSVPEVVRFEVIRLKTLSPTAYSPALVPRFALPEADELGRCAAARGVTETLDVSRSRIYNVFTKQGGWK